LGLVAGAFSGTRRTPAIKTHQTEEKEHSVNVSVGRPMDDASEAEWTRYIESTTSQPQPQL
jgi:hypothetical protein